MRRYLKPRAGLLAIALIAILTSCGILGGNSGTDEAARSCMQETSSGFDAAKIVPVGIKHNYSDDLTVASTDLEIVQSRAILSAEAAAKDPYWQPLADAWALNEALLQAIINSGVTPDPASTYSEFIKNVNLEYASTAKDTYCRIAFSKKAIEINYKSDSK